MLSVGIDIGGSSVKLAEVQANNKSYSVTRFQEFPLSNDPTRDKKIQILEILREIASAYDPNQTRISMVIEQQNVAFRNRLFPFKERFKILRSIAFELEDDIPFSQEDAIFDAKITRYVDNSADVIATACPKEYLKDLIQLAREAGLEPDVISVEGLALHNLVEDWQSPPPQQAGMSATPESKTAEIILDIGHNRSVLLISSEKCLLTARNIDFGGRQIAEFISQKYGIHYLEALKEMQKKAFLLLSHEGATRDQIAFSDTMKQALEPLIQEVKFTILETTASRNVQIKTGHVTGGPSQIKNLGPYLTQKWEMAINRFKHFSIYPNIAIENTTTNEALSATAIGIALEGLRRPRNPAINLLKGEFAPEGATFKIFWEKWGYTAKLIGTAFMLLLVYGFMRESFAVNLAETALEDLKAKADKIAKIKGRMATPSNIKKFVKSKKEELAARKVAQQVKQINSSLDLISKIHQTAPGPKQMLVEIRKLKVENELLEVHGEVSEPKSVGLFKKTLEAMALDGRVETISSAVNPGPGKTGFGFRMKVERHRGG